MCNRIRVVDDSRLPEGHDWMLMTDGDHTLIFVAESAAQECACAQGRRCPIATSADRSLQLIAQRKSA